MQEILSKFAVKDKKDRSKQALDELMDDLDIRLYGSKGLEKFKDSMITQGDSVEEQQEEQEED